VTVGNGTFAATLRNARQAFTAAGQLRVSQVFGNTLIEGNTDSNFANAEFQLWLNNVTAANVLASDFVR